MLFNNTSSLLTPPSATDRAVRHPATPGNKYVINEAWTDLHAVIGELLPNHHYHFISEGKWNAVQLLKYLMDECGPGPVRICSWSVSENSVRELVELVHSGLISDLQCLFDFRVVQHTPGAYELARENFPVKLSMVHAKITAVKGSKMSAVVIGSANYNDNRRIEVGMVNTSPKDVEYYFDFLHKKINTDEQGTAD